MSDYLKLDSTPFASYFEGLQEESLLTKGNKKLEKSHSVSVNVSK